MNFDMQLKARAAYANQVIEAYLPAEEGFAAGMAEAMNYSMRAGGKRIRPVLLKAAFDLFGGEGRLAEPFMAAIEMIHTHSLVHDDLPALDNDELRRGKPTTHKAYGEAVAVLAGDALLNRAYETALTAFSLTGDTGRVVRALCVLSGKSGIDGMLGGQSVDVMNDGKPLTRELLDYIYENKTARLLEAPLMMGAILAGASAEDVARMEQLGYLTGLAFQIRDDILDVTATAQELGKPIGSDDRNHKVTYVTLMGLAGAERKVQELSERALAVLQEISGDSEFLRELIAYLAGRKN